MHLAVMYNENAQKSYRNLEVCTSHPIYDILCLMNIGCVYIAEKCVEGKTSSQLHCKWL